MDVRKRNSSIDFTFKRGEVPDMNMHGKTCWVTAADISYHVGVVTVNGDASPKYTATIRGRYQDGKTTEPECVVYRSWDRCNIPGWFKKLIESNKPSWF
ncbi:hypothetical protein SEA_TOMAS_188 [Streptomyces phage Tomas]|uniref:Uncharacterized protein n=1 Tax=Streptomyces phage Tomas TaxID=2914443 RepID=A0AA49H3R7_9CAUD|nr:hypothetical protein PP453_gp130 [Streptomyces phage Tomas]UMO76337.1 hypothetical protein SEA_TOMAS_188 [Streptomyces phage Tomas]